MTALSRTLTRHFALQIARAFVTSALTFVTDGLRKLRSRYDRPRFRGAFGRLRSRGFRIHRATTIEQPPTCERVGHTGRSDTCCTAKRRTLFLALLGAVLLPALVAAVLPNASAEDTVFVAAEADPTTTPSDGTSSTTPAPTTTARPPRSRRSRPPRPRSRSRRPPRRSRSRCRRPRRRRRWPRPLLRRLPWPPLHRRGRAQPPTRRRSWRACAGASRAATTAVVSSNGLWFGAYQMTRQTWDSAGAAGRATGPGRRAAESGVAGAIRTTSPSCSTAGSARARGAAPADRRRDAWPTGQACLVTLTRPADQRAPGHRRSASESRARPELRRRSEHGPAHRPSGRRRRGRSCGRDRCRARIADARAGRDRRAMSPRSRSTVICCRCCARRSNRSACTWSKVTPCASIGRRPCRPSATWTLVANLPYNVATPLVLDLLDDVPTIRRMLVMVQREVGERLAAKAGDDAYGIPSVKVAYWATANVVGRVGASRVRATTTRRVGARAASNAGDAPAVAADPTLLFGLVRTAFGQRRKMLRRSLDGVVSASAVRQPPRWPRRRAPRSSTSRPGAVWPTPSARPRRLERDAVPSPSRSPRPPS